MRAIPPVLGRVKAMLKNLLGGLAGRNKKPQEERVAVPEPVVEAFSDTPLSRAEHGPVDLPHTLGFVSHQPILDRQHRVVAYEFVVKEGKGPATIDAAKRLDADRL